MNTKTHRALALFAATALTAGSLVACAPQASTSKDSQKAEASATSQSSETGSPKQTEEKPAESTTSATSSSSGTSQTEQTEQTNATSANTTSGTASPEAAPSQNGITGWLIGVCLDGSSATNPAVTSAALSNGTLTIEGSMASSDSEPQSIPEDRSTWLSGPMTFTVDENTRWQARGGVAGTTDIDSEQLIQVVNSHNGLGLIIQAENGVVRSITLAS